MNINEMTSLCNDKYFEALISVKMHEDALVIHQKVLSVAQSLLELSKIDLKRSDEIKIKAEKIILIAKSINKSVSYFELYQKLIAEKIQDLESENDFIVINNFDSFISGIVKLISFISSKVSLKYVSNF
jgi:hypothetical protein